MQIYELEGPDGVGKTKTIEEVIPLLQKKFPTKKFFRMALPGNPFDGFRRMYETKTAKSLMINGDRLVWTEEPSEISHKTIRMFGRGERARIVEEISRLEGSEDFVVLADRGLISSHVYDFMLDEINEGRGEQILVNPDPKHELAAVNKDHYPINGVVFLTPNKNLVDKEDMPYSLRDVLNCYESLMNGMMVTKHIPSVRVPGLTEATTTEVVSAMTIWLLKGN